MDFISNSKVRINKKYSNFTINSIIKIMKASTQYTDLVGTAAADISDSSRSNTLEEVAQHFNLDKKRFKIIGLSIYGIGRLSVSLICEDLSKSTNDKKYIVKLLIDNVDDVIALVLKRLHVVLYNKRDEVYPDIELSEELHLSDFTSTENN